MVRNFNDFILVTISILKLRSVEAVDKCNIMAWKRQISQVWWAYCWTCV